MISKALPAWFRPIAVMVMLLAFVAQSAAITVPPVQKTMNPATAGLSTDVPADHHMMNHGDPGPAGDSADCCIGDCNCSMSHCGAALAIESLGGILLLPEKSGEYSSLTGSQRRFSSSLYRPPISR